MPSVPRGNVLARGLGRQAGGILWFFLRWILLLGLAAAFGAVLYGVHLDRVVRVKFEGKRWALPARVYARPLELYVGRALSVNVLQAELDRLGYRAVQAPSRAGTYALDQGRFLIHTRPFRFWDGEEPERTLDLTIADGSIASIADAGGGPAPVLVRLDAALIASIYPTHN